MEQTNPDTGVSQEAPDIQSRLQNFLTQFDEDQADGNDAQTEPVRSEQSSATEKPEAEAQADSDELTPDDLTADSPTPQADADAFEIVHNGTQHKLTRADTIKYAQQGFDYTQKTQALADQARQMQDRLRAVYEIEQMQPHLIQELGAVTAFQSQLQQYQNVDWVRLASEDPLEYPKHRAQYDTLVNAYQRAIGQYQQKQQMVQRHVQALTAQKVQQEAAKLKTLVPDFNENMAQEVRNYLTESGISSSDIDRMNDAVGVALVVKAMKYDRLAKAKAEKVKQLRTAPPVTRPGAAQTGAANVEQVGKLTQRLRRTGDVKDAAALLASRWK